MAAVAKPPTLDSLLEQGVWAGARVLIERELSARPDDHWLLTQLGVTHYEQGHYRDALRPLLAALDLVPDCPLALWNLAGTLDALGKPEVAVPIYTWLLKSKTSPADDPCWESRAWADALKTDCVYRIGAALQRMGRRDSAATCFRQYINLLLAGMTGTYPIEDAAQHVRDLHVNGTVSDVQAAIGVTLQDAGVRAVGGVRRKLPKLSLADLLAG